MKDSSRNLTLLKSCDGHMSFAGTSSYGGCGGTPPLAMQHLCGLMQPPCSICSCAAVPPNADCTIDECHASGIHLLASGTFASFRPSLQLQLSLQTSLPPSLQPRRPRSQKTQRLLPLRTESISGMRLAIKEVTRSEDALTFNYKLFHLSSPGLSANL